MRQLDPHDPRPLYRQLADDLRSRIRQMDPGDPVPSLAGLQAEYGVGAQTVRRAVGLLQQEGRITRTRGRRFEVTDTAGVNTVYVGPSATVGARVATPADRREHGTPEGAYVLVVADEGEEWLYPAASTVIRFRA